MTWIYQHIFYNPLANALAVLLSFIPGENLGVAIIFLTLVVRAVLFPFSHKMIYTQHAMKKIQPRIAEIKKFTKGDREKEYKELTALYKEHGISPFSSIIVMIIQIPLLIALYQVLSRVGGPFTGVLYTGVTIPEVLNHQFLGVDLLSTSIVLALIAAVLQYIQIALSLPPKPQKTENTPPDTQGDIQRAMSYTLPLVIFIVGMKFIAALPLYWTVMNLTAIVHEGIMRRRLGKPEDWHTTNTPIM